MVGSSRGRVLFLRWICKFQFVHATCIFEAAQAATVCRGLVDGVISALVGNQWCCGKSRVSGGPEAYSEPPLSGRLLLPRQHWRARCTTTHTTQPILGPPGASKTGNPRDTSNVNLTPPLPTDFIVDNQFLVDLANINNSLVDSPFDERRRIPWLIKLLLDCKFIQSLVVIKQSDAPVFRLFFSQALPTNTY